MKKGVFMKAGSWKVSKQKSMIVKKSWILGFEKKLRAESVSNKEDLE